jgi:hypothetical protein
MDPDAVVALASSTFTGTSSHEAPTLRSGDDEVSLQHGLHESVNERTASVLDALAELCVHNSKHDVVAVGLRLSLPEVQLLVATNDKTPDRDTIKHLKEVWHALNKISDEHFSKTSDKNINMDVLSPEITASTEEEQSLCNDLLRRLYHYSYDKLLRRHDKYWKVLEEFQKALEKEHDLTDENEDASQILQTFVNHLRDLTGKITLCEKNNWEVDDTELKEDLLGLLDETLSTATAMLVDRTACDTWMSKVNCEF